MSKKNQVETKMKEKYSSIARELKIAMNHELDGISYSLSLEKILEDVDIGDKKINFKRSVKNGRIKEDIGR